MRRQQILLITTTIALLFVAVPASAFDPSALHGTATDQGAKEPAARIKKRSKPSPRRSSATLSPYRDLGAWVDMFDRQPWKHTRRTVTAMTRHGASTLYLETSNYSKAKDLYRPRAIERFIRAAHEKDMAAVAWYVPSFKNLKRDLRRSMKAIRFRTDEGERFDSFALDIEATVVGDIGKRNERFANLARRIRKKVGDDYKMGAIVPEAGALYWPNFPYREAARHFDVFLPMAYYTYRVNGRSAVRRFIENNVATIRRSTGDPTVPVHPIGGIGGDGTRSEAEGYVTAVKNKGAIGGSFYDFPITTRGEWAALERLAR